MPRVCMTIVLEYEYEINLASYPPGSTLEKACRLNTAGLLDDPVGFLQDSRIILTQFLNLDNGEDIVEFQEAELEEIAAAEIEGAEANA